MFLKFMPNLSPSTPKAAEHREIVDTWLVCVEKSAMENNMFTS